MKYCLNCNTPNELQVGACVNCRMKGRFSEPVQENETSDPGKDADVSPCRNCGTDTRGLDRCPNCRFPLRPAQQMSAVRFRPDTAQMHHNHNFIN